MEEFDESARTTPYDHPVLATLAGAAILVIGALLLPRFSPQQPLSALLGAGAVLGLLLWIIGFVVTTRYSALPWKLGSLTALLVTGLGAALIAHSQYQTIARADASSFAEVDFGPSGAAQLPAGAASRGRLSRLFAESVTAEARAQQDFSTAFGKLGAGNLTSPYLLEQDPRALGQCAAIAGLGSQAQTQAAARRERARMIAEALDSANLPASAKQGIATMAGTRATDAANDPRLANQLAIASETAALCELLARRGWFNNGGYFGFRSAADQARFRALAERRMKLAGDAERIERTAQARMTEGRNVVREALSKSIFAGE